MHKKKVLIDLSALSNLTCGFGQIALNYGTLFGRMDLDDIEFTFLVPKSFTGYFGEKVNYVSGNNIYKLFPALLPKVDIWHSIHQKYRYAHVTKQTKQILTIHDLNFLQEKRTLKAQRYLDRLQKMINKASLITFISSYALDEAARNADLHGKEIRMIYNGVQRIDQDTGQMPVFVKDSQRPFFFTIGQIRAKKNFHVLLDVMKAFPQHDLYVAGEDHREYAQWIKQRIEQERIPNVFLPGKISHPEKVWMYKHCEAFLFPSLLEGFGLPVIEAMQFGKAVLSSPASSLTEICGGHAFLWENFEPEYMIQSIRNYLPFFYGNKEKVENEQEYAFSFTYEKNVKAYLDLYRTL